MVELLLERGSAPIIATTRTPEKLADLAARGVEVRRADYDDPDLPASAFAGVRRMLLISTDALDQPGRRFAQHRTAIAAAVRAGVQHIVYTSLVSCDPGSPVLIAPDHHQTEVTLEQSGVPYTVLRNNLYTDFLVDTVARAVQTGELVNACDAGAVGFVTREDCAQAAAAALSAPRPGGGSEVLDITGPGLITWPDIARIATQLSGRAVRHLSVEPEAVEASLVASGLPRYVAQVFTSYDVAVSQGRMAVATTAVEALTGRRPTSVAEFLTAHRTALV